jgi:hypothetical protein
VTSIHSLDATIWLDTKTLNASKKHYHKNSTDFGFAVQQRQTEVKSDYRKKAGKLDAEYHQPGDATTFKSILNEYGKGGEVLGLVVGYLTAFFLPPLFFFPRLLSYQPSSLLRESLKLYMKWPLCASSP